MGVDYFVTEGEILESARKHEAHPNADEQAGVSVRSHFVFHKREEILGRELLLGIGDPRDESNPFGLQ